MKNFPTQRRQDSYFFLQLFVHILPENSFHSTLFQVHESHRVIGVVSTVIVSFIRTQLC